MRHVETDEERVERELQDAGSRVLRCGECAWVAGTGRGGHLPWKKLHHHRRAAHGKTTRTITTWIDQTSPELQPERDPGAHLKRIDY
jgi:hypothetical protein